MMLTRLAHDPTTRVRSFACFVLCGLVIALAFHGIMESRGFEWPWTSFLFMPGDRYNDWHNSVLQAASGDPYFSRQTPALAAYFPASYLVFDLASGMDRRMSTLLYLGISELLLVAAVFSLYFRNQVTATGTPNQGRFELPLLLVLTLQCSYPLLFALDRGNIDPWLACGCTLFVATQGSRFRHFGLAMLGLSIAAKGYPAAFLLLTLARREYKEVVFCWAVALAASLAGLLSFHGDIAHSVVGLESNLHLFHERYVLGVDSLFASSDPYNAIRLLASGLASGQGIDASRLHLLSSTLLTIYNPLILLSALCCAAFVLLVRVPAWRQVTAVALLALLFPNLANDYKLCCLFPGLLLLLLSDRPTRRERVSLGLFALLMIPKSYYFLNGHPISMLINPMLLAALAWQVMGDRDAWRAAWHRHAPIRSLP